MTSKYWGTKLSQSNWRHCPGICRDGIRNIKKIPLRTATLQGPKFEPETSRVRTHAHATVSKKLHNSGHWLSLPNSDHCRRDSKHLSSSSESVLLLLSNSLEAYCSAIEARTSCEPHLWELTAANRMPAFISA